jgi:membrane-bound serine protease (ClpP class)
MRAIAERLAPAFGGASGITNEGRFYCEQVGIVGYDEDMRSFYTLILLFFPMLAWAQTPGAASEPAPDTPVPGVAAPADAPNKRVFGKSDEESYEGKVVVIKVGESDLGNKQSFKFIRRTLRRAKEEGATAIVFELNTPGGYAFETQALMREMVATDIPQFTFINPMAGSAGALLAVATNEIYMAPSSVVGAAAVVNGTGEEIEKYMRAKLESFFDAQVRSIVSKRGHNIEVVRAMMLLDEENERTFGSVTVGKGELLSINAEEAVQLVEGKPLFAKAVVRSMDELLEMEGLSDVPLVTANQTAFERMAWWVKYLSPVLILIGLGAGYAEMKAPGFGVFGLFSLVAFAVFFFGNYVAGNLAGYELAAVFVAGLLLILVEIFVIPGTGVTGLLGALLVVGSLLAGMVDEIDFGDFTNDEFSGGSVLSLLSWPALSLSIGLAGGMLMIALLIRYFQMVPGMGLLTMKGQLADGPSISGSAGEGAASRVGWTGTAATDLRPAGKAEFADETLDVVTDGTFVSKGEAVRVTDEEGIRIEVRKA